jgi:hypothetical protein
MRGSRAKNANVCHCGRSDPAYRHSASKTRVNALLAHAGYKGRGTKSQRSAARILCFWAPGTPIPFFLSLAEARVMERREAPGDCATVPLGVCETPLADSLRRSLPAHLGRAQRGPPPGMRDPSDVGASASRRSTTAGKQALPAALNNSQACAHGAMLDCFGSARVGHMNPRPRAPPPALSAERLRKTPLSERGGRNMDIFPAKSQGIRS